MTTREKPPQMEEALRLDALERQQITDTPRDEAFDRLVHLACGALAAPVGAISFLESERLWVKAAQGIGVCEAPRDTTFSTHALHDDDLLVVEDASRDPRFAANPYVTEHGLRFYAGAPLTTAEGFRLGTLSVADHIPRKISQGDREMLKNMAALVIGEMELRRRAGTDVLTGLHTRRFFTEIGGRELIKARRDGWPLTAAFVDADHFRRINDSLGHEAGDAVLRAIGPVCRRVLRGSDLLGRYDGEELVLLLPNTNLEQAAPVLERLREQIAALRLAEFQSLQVTVSVGAAELSPDDLTLDDLLARADKAVHRAKGAGRNRVALAA
jgi:diguanylate cyclase (GGDEF)-like protein